MLEIFHYEHGFGLNKKVLNKNTRDINKYINFSSKS